MTGSWLDIAMHCFRCRKRYDVVL